MCRKFFPFINFENMQFNGVKFEVLRYGRNQELKISTSYFTPNFKDIIEEKNNLRVV